MTLGLFLSVVCTMGDFVKGGVFDGTDAYFNIVLGLGRPIGLIFEVLFSRLFDTSVDLFIPNFNVEVFHLSLRKSVHLFVDADV